MSAASHPVVSLIFPYLSSNFRIFFCLSSYQLVSSGVEMLVPHCLEDRIILIHLKSEHCPTFFRIVLSAFRQKSLSTSSGCAASDFLKKPRKPWILPGATGLWWVLQVLQHLGLIWRAPAFSRQGRLPCAGSESTAGDANQLFSVTCTPVKTVWLCVSWTLIFLSLCLLISSNYSLFTLDWKLSLRLNHQKLTLIFLRVMPTVRH